MKKICIGWFFVLYHGGVLSFSPLNDSNEKFVDSILNFAPPSLVVRQNFLIVPKQVRLFDWGIAIMILGYMYYLMSRLNCFNGLNKF